MPVTFGQFFNAIAEQESGGNYRAVNSRTGALGKYQVLPSNVPYWSQKYLGYKISPAQYLRSSDLQDTLAKAVLKDYYNRYGARGAASTWYSGSPSGANNYRRFRSNEPSIGEYVDGVLGKARSQPGGVDIPDDPAPGSAPVMDTLPSRDDLVGGSTWQQRSSIDPTDEGTGMIQLDYSGAGIDTPTEGEGISLGKDDNEGNSQPGVALGGEIAEPDPAVNAPAGQPTGDASGLRQQVLNLAKTFIGKPYVWGAEGPTAFDCSGLIQYTMSQLGIDMPRVSFQQANAGRKVSVDKLQPGDLVAWDYSGRNQGADHIAFYAGNGKVLEAPAPGMQVRVHNLYDLSGHKPWGVSLDDIYGRY